VPKPTLLAKEVTQEELIDVTIITDIAGDASLRPSSTAMLKFSDFDLL
jgi:hypothetical protein